MASITATTGTIDVQGIVDQLMKIEKAPLDKLAEAQKTNQTQISAWGKLKGELSAVQEAARKLYSVTTWNATTIKSTNEEAVKASTTGGSPKGAFSVSVQQLAQAQSASTGKFSGADAVVGGGKLVIQMGSRTEGGFSADDARAALSIDIQAGATLADVRTAINNAGAGISASLVNDGGQTRLMIRSSETGAANAFSIAVENAENGGATGLGALAFTPGGGGAMTEMQVAQDAKFKIDGLELTSAKNTVTNALDGVNLELRKVTTDGVGVEVGADTEGMRAAFDAFVTAYNTLNASLTSLTKYDDTTKTAGLFQGNYLVVQLQSKLRSTLSGLFAPTVAPGGGAAPSMTRLSDMGLEVQRDGSLKINDTKFNGAMDNPKAMRELIGASDTANANGNGLARRISTLLSDMMSSDGAISGAIGTLERRNEDNQRRQDNLNSRLESTRARLVRVYSQLDSNLQSMSGLSNSLAGQLAQLDNNWK